MNSVKPSVVSFGEWAQYDTEEQREAARTYLLLWKRYVVKRLAPSWAFYCEEWDDRPAVEDPNCEPEEVSTLGIKVWVRWLGEECK